MSRHASMNRIYRLIWNPIRSAWVPVAETARGRGKSGRAKSGSTYGVVAGVSLALAPLAHASGAPPPCVAPACGVGAVSASSHPTGGHVVSGRGTISQAGDTTTIQQSSQNLFLDWLSFNVGSEETVNFVQPSANAIAVNEISSINGSQILGHLNANGEVWLVNPNGIVFGEGAQVNVGSLVASTLNEVTLSGNTASFSGSGAGSIVNEGTINAATGGSVALLGNHVSNEGSITARLGTVALGAGSAVTLTFSGNSLVKMQVDESTLNTLAENGGLIEADGGTVILSAGAKEALLASVVNNTGVIEARTVESHDGTIELLGGMTAGTVNVGGTLDASAPEGGHGGFIETNAAHVEVANDAKVTTAAANGLFGTWLIDPTDFTVSRGGDESGGDLSAALSSSNVTILSSNGTSPVTGGGSGGNINIDDTVSWSANTTLTLTAANNVNVNANMTATGNTVGLVINPNTANGSQTAGGSGAFNLAMGNSITLSGTNPSLSISGNAYTVINSLGAAASTTGTDLQGMNGNLAGYYALGSNIDASATSGWNGGAGFTPIGNATAAFTGTFNGLGHTISNLTINLPSAIGVGLFGYAGTGSVIQNVGLVGGSVTGEANVGGLVGYNQGTVSNSYATGNVSGGSDSVAVGGLVGLNSYGTVTHSYATGSVSGPNGSSDIGGLVGDNYRGTVSNSYATGNVSGGSDSGAVGGLVGLNSYGTATNSYATGSVSGSSNVGGLVGINYGGSISNSYATGSVSGTTLVGGLVASNTNGGTITNSYATGSVSGAGDAGGLVGENSSSTVTNSFWDSGQSSSAGGTGMTTAQMQTQANFTSATSANGNVNPGWDFTNTWVMYSGHTFPLLSSFMTPLTVTADNAIATYNGSAYSGNVSYSVTPNANLLGTLTLSYSGTSQGAVNVGSYVMTPGGLYSNQEGYIISYVTGTLIIGQLASVAWVGGATGNWSQASNWAGGAIPDLSNVAAVTIPKGTTVTYDAGVAGTTILTSLTDGKLVMAAGDLTITGNLSAAGYRQTGGLLDVGGTLTINATAGSVIVGNIDAGALSIASTKGAISQLAGSTLDVSGASTLAAGTGTTAYSITLTQPTDSFGGEVSAQGLNISLLDTSSNGLTLGNTTATGTLTATSRGGAIAQAGSTAVEVTGATSLTANDGAVKYDITLAQAGNSFGGVVSSNGLNIDLEDGSANGLTLGNTTATGTLTDTSLGGAITQAPSTALTVTGASSLTADNGVGGAGDAKYDITLANATNHFTGAVSSDGLDIDLLDKTGGLELGNTTATGTFTATSLGGAITQLVSTALDVTGATSLTASHGGALNYNVTLGQAANNFGGTVTADGSAITLEDAAALTVNLDSSGASTLTSVGAMNVTGTVGTALKTTTTGANSATTFGATTVGTNLTVTSTGAVTETSANILEVDGKGTTTVANPHVTVNGVKGAQIPAP
jgi:filamentous hemagglutinin family protein